MECRKDETFSLLSEQDVVRTRQLARSWSVAITLVELGLELPGVQTALDVEKGMALIQRAIQRG